MRRFFVRFGGPPGNGFRQRWGFGVIVLPALLAIWAAAMAMIGPTSNPWIPDEIMAELSGANYGPPSAPVQADASR
jgi:hypothetical protein